MNPPFVDMVGMKFNKLLVLSYSHIKKRHRYWLCKCDCGTIKAFRGDGVKNGRIRSCGCLNRIKSEETKLKISISRKGKSPKTRPPEFGKKMSEVRMGMKFSDEHKKHLSEAKKGHTPWNKDKTNIYSLEHLKAMSERQKGKVYPLSTRLKLSKLHSGKNHWNWNPNLTDEYRAKRKRDYAEYRFWRTDVYRRDGYVCQKCKLKKPKKLRAHHIESYADNPELRIELSNGITLCNDCHDNLHHLFGYGNNTRIQMEIFMNTHKEVCSGGA